jgi:hypothetical protein
MMPMAVMAIRVRLATMMMCVTAATMASTYAAGPTLIRRYLALYAGDSRDVVYSDA